ncbi:dihydroorotase [Dysgonomonas sp. 25]|uniref:dihydroorotase n=1 Tax=Dysgonomonas sp. 25 TaxID=2302933 RepID=UPI0013D1D4BA|nr:dihydroorotase [Dysgonomonas sp. 25]NDV68370.1 dihydroorotase [Dysgonomonas sp. 25]
MILIHKATIINEGRSFTGSVLVENDKIKAVYEGQVPEEIINRAEVVDATGLWLLPGVIDDQVHFRDPGLTYKGDIATESRAAIAGGVTSFMDMPNTKPQTTTIDELNRKFELGAEKSYANYSFYLGATNDNIAELRKVDRKTVCGVKVFMGSSTGNMLVDKKQTLQAIFAEVDMLIACHCEKEEIIRRNLEYYQSEYKGESDIPIQYHPLIRSAEACYESSSEAAELASRYDSRLHILHLSTAREVSIFDAKPLAEKKITGEVCVHHLWFSDEDYATYGARIKWNPAIKTKADREGLMQGLLNGRLDVIATDHAPHLWEEKQGGALKASSGGPLVQHSLQVMLELAKDGRITKEQVVEKMCHAPATLFHVHKRGYIREGYFADLVLVDPNNSYTVSKENILYKCHWSPFEGQTFAHSIVQTYLNGKLAFDKGEVKEVRGEALMFDY